METQPHPQQTHFQPKTSGMAIASLVCGILGICLVLPAPVGLLLGIMAIRQINGSSGAIGGKGLAIGGLATSGVGMIACLGISASMLLPALARAKAKANRVKCVNNIGNVYKAGLAFAQDNGERLPWQLTTSGVHNHFDPTAGASDQYGRWRETSINEVKAHPNSLAAAGVYGLTAMKAELVTPKILHSPCDVSRAMNNEIVQMNWMGYDTKADGVSTELGEGVSYVLCRGADTQRPSAVYALTRNWSDDHLDVGEWIGSDSDPGNSRTIAGLTYSQGQLVTMDGGAQQSNNSDFQANGRLTKAARSAAGGVARGQTSLNLIRGPGL